MKTNYTFLVIE
uniref:Uncharacterized protein n=1 Tax=Anguilla anguilla TaxID=7936 RepID=A0A0E9RRC7_ANGAN